jgi:hypothetical protein
VEIRIVVPAAGSASALADRLSTTYGTERISFFSDRAEIAVRVASESDGAVIGIVESVERWLDHAGLASAEMWLGEHLYRLACWVPEGRDALNARARARARATVVQPHPITARNPRRARARPSRSRRHVWVSA